jgi:hypothetical protein
MEILSSVFDEARDIDGRTLGGQGKEVMFNSRMHIGDLKFTDNDPLTAWVQYALVAGHEWIRHMGPGLQPQVDTQLKFGNIAHPTPVPTQPLQFKDHSAMAEVWTQALAATTWPLADGAVDRLPQAGDKASNSAANAPTSKKHPRDESESDVPEGSSASQRSRGEHSICSFAYSSTNDSSAS